jgi:glucose/arabinose dehydrogenase
MKNLKFLTFLFMLSSICFAQTKSDLLNKIKLPTNYHIEIYVDQIDNARAMTFAEDSTLFVGSRNAGNVYAFKNGRVIVIDSGLSMPSGIAYLDGDLYVGAISTIYKYPDILVNLKNPKREIVTEIFPSDTWHGWKYLRFGPDGKLYVPVGAACNVCDSANPIYASINTINKDGSGFEIYAKGVRNTVGFDFHPETGVLWFTDNGRDLMGDTIPPDELNKAPEKGMHFGFPYLHGHSVKDPDYWKQRPKDLQITKPEWELEAHTAALGMKFYTGDMFEEKYKNGIFIAEHGSWNRSNKVGYRVSFVTVKNGKARNYKVFASGWLENEDFWGRPADIAVGPDGALYISDDFANCIYRIYYKKD